MSDFNRDYPRPAAAGAADMAVDAGLRAFMLGVYNKVGLGLLLSAALAYVTSSVPPVRDLLFQQVDRRRPRRLHPARHDRGDRAACRSC